MTPLLLNRLLPFHVRLDPDGHIVGMGPSLAKLLPPSSGVSIVELMTGADLGRGWLQPGIQRVTFHDPAFSLRGEFFSNRDWNPDAEPGWLFAAVLDPEDASRIVELGLSASDFAAADLSIEFSILQWSRDSQVEETRSALDRLRDSTALGRTLKVQATTDGLTQIANRARFIELLEEALPLETPVEVMMIDLDRFKTVNDLHGHHVGDMMLQAAATHLTSVVGTMGTVARLGGDEFAVLLVGEAATNAADAIAADIAGLNGAMQNFGDSQVPIRLTVGRARRINEREAGALMRHADTAMYSARNTPGLVVGLFDPRTQRELELRRSIATDIRGALANNDIRMHYQPIVSLKTHQPLGYEVLSRWHHPTHGNIRPDVFVAVAETSNLVEELDRYVIRTALREVTAHLRIDGQLPRLSVNVSALSLTDEMVEYIVATLAHAKFPAAHLSVEVTETASIMDFERTARVLGRLDKLGVVVALDDFGTGFSSLAYLHQLPIGALKIDRSFVMDMATSRKALEVIRSILQVASSLNLPVVAEGIETPFEADLLHRLGCSHGQGYWFARPAPIESVAEYQPTVSTERANETPAAIAAEHSA